jgi:hypothetical protein
MIKNNMDKKLREFVISVLDNDNGISDKSFTILNEIAEKYKLEDIVLTTYPFDNSVHFLTEEDANMLRNKE